MPAGAQVATPVQAARADQLSYPHLPNLMAMCSALASSNGGSGDAASPPHAKRPKVDQSAATATEDGAWCPVHLCLIRACRWHTHHANPP